jgi:hypothetical protein
MNSFREFFQAHKFSFTTRAYFHNNKGMSEKLGKRRITRFKKYFEQWHERKNFHLIF